MTFDELLNRGRTRSIFLFIFIISVLFLLAVRYYVMPQGFPALKQGWVLIVSSLIDNLVSTGIVTVTLGFLLWWLTPYRVRNAGINVVEPRELKIRFDHALNTTSSWKFAGGCGRYFRSAVVRRLEERARHESSTKSAVAIILNPENSRLCEQHAHYRSSTRRGHDEGNWTAIRVKQELLATLVIAKSACSMLFDVKVYFSDHFRGDRLDIAECYAIETREDRSAPALQSDSGSYFYQAVMNDFRLIEGQARPIHDGEQECRGVTDIATLKKALYAMDVKNIDLNDGDLGEVVRLVMDRKNPYE